MNYFIDETKPVLDEQNRFTAIELSSMIPVAGSDAYNKLMSANKWISNFLPNGYTRFFAQNEACDPISGLKAAQEAIINKMNPMGLNKRLMNLTDKKWRRKWAKKNYPMDQYDIAFKTTLHISKNHSANHQKKVMEVIGRFNKPNE